MRLIWCNSRTDGYSPDEKRHFLCTLGDNFFNCFLFFEMEVLCLKNMTTKNLALIGMMGALGAIMMLMRFPIPFLPPFLSFDFSIIPELIGGFALGPCNAFLIIVVKILIQLVISGTNSMFTGELQGLLLSCSLVLPASMYYQHHKTRNSAALGMMIGITICTITAIFTNMYLIIPFYISLYDMNMDMIIEMCKEVNPFVDSLGKMVIFGIVPFNLIKTGLNGLITFLVYKKISPMIHSFAKRKGGHNI